jgi:hypothetical protein
MELRVKRIEVPEIGENVPSPGRLSVTIKLNQSPPVEWIRVFHGLFTEAMRAHTMPGWTDPAVRGELISYTPNEGDLENSVMMMDARIAEANAAYEQSVLPQIRIRQEAERLAGESKRAQIEDVRERAQRLLPPA